MNTIKTISFIGAGNVATNLARAFYEKGFSVEYIFSKTIENATLLAKVVGGKPINSFKGVRINSDLVVVALKDDVIVEVLEVAMIRKGFLVHTSGSFNTKQLQPFSEQYGCFYPFQTFRKEIVTQLDEIHIFVETNSKTTTDLLKNIALLFSKQVVEMNSEERKALHIAGVGLNNFTHYLLSITKQYCEANNLKPEYLTQLLQQTVNNSFYVQDALNLQTGPARRGDVAIIREHISKLDNAPKFQKIYKAISQLILDEFYEDQFQL